DLRRRSGGAGRGATGRGFAGPDRSGYGAGIGGVIEGSESHGDRQAGERPITIVLADDHRVVRAGLKLLLEAQDDFEVVAEAGDVELTVRRVAAYRPSVLVLDVNMPGGSSLPAISRILDSAPDTRIVVLTMQADAGLAREALRSGATGYVLKEAAETELIQ